jgi:hypothetical protein
MQTIEAASLTLGTAPACDALGVARASVYRLRQPAKPSVARPASPRALTHGERQGVLEMAQRLIDATCAKQGIAPRRLTLHADHVSSMRSKPVALLLADVGVVKDPQPAPCVERQTVLRGAEVPSRVSRALRRP